ncbi:MBL fold metallo-hydrolase RNA specificity domain-containing protein [Halobacteriales archaeon Cl-PHB]
MTERIDYGDGLTIHLASGETVVADASYPDGDVTVVSHAHGDHLYSDPPAVMVASELTRDLAAVRRDASPPPVVDHPRIDLLDAGHVPGSSAALIEGERTYLYTGDVNTRDRLYMEGFDPPAADVLVVESTYGTPDYEFPPLAEERANFEDWLAVNADAPVICFGYALGRAQEVEYLLGESDRERLFASDAILEIDRVVEDHLDVEFPGKEWSKDVDLRAGDALILPSQTSGFGWVESLVEETGAATAGFSGWAVDSGFKFANGFDETFVLSDHCDFSELCGLVEAVDPEEVYTLHGSADEFASYLTSELGYEATALKRGQSRLSQFY